MAKGCKETKLGKWIGCAAGAYVGGTAGAATGTAVGGTVGTVVVPGIGTVSGAAVGAYVGAGVGGIYGCKKGLKGNKASEVTDETICGLRKGWRWTKDKARRVANAFGFGKKKKSKKGGAAVNTPVTLDDLMAAVAASYAEGRGPRVVVRDEAGRRHRLPSNKVMTPVLLTALYGPAFAGLKPDEVLGGWWTLWQRSLQTHGPDVAPEVRLDFIARRYFTWLTTGGAVAIEDFALTPPAADDVAALEMEAEEGADDDDSWKGFVALGLLAVGLGLTYTLGA